MAQKKTTTTTKEQQAATSAQTTNQQQVTSGTGTSTVTVPKWLQPFVKGSAAVGGQALTAAQQGVNQFTVPQETLDTLRNYASGGFLYGGPEQDAYMRAQMDAVTPNIIQGFGGMGGNPLAAQAAMRSGQNAFANLFPQEQAFQLQAANALPQMQMLPIQLQMQLAQQGFGGIGQLAPLFGQNTTSNTISNLTGATNTNSTMTGKKVGVETQPLYQTPGWQTALGIGSAAASFIPGIGPLLGAGMNAGGQVLGGLLGQR